MTTLRKKVLVVVSAIVVTLAIVVLPGCAKKEPAPGAKKAESTKKDITKEME